MRSQFRGKHSSPFGQPSKTEQLPTPRRMGLEKQLADAMKARVQVEFTFDRKTRVFEPHAVFHSLKHKVNVAGTQVRNLASPSDASGPHDFEVGRIDNLRVTDRKFTADPRFDRAHPKYRNGIISSI